MVLATLAIVTVVALPDVYPAVVDAATRQSDEDSRTQGYVVVTARAHVYASSDPLPTDISAADYAAFWNEPALNTPDAVALLEVLNEASAKDLRNSTDHLRSTAQTIRNPDKRANAHAAVDELAELLTHGRIQQAKRMVYEDLTALAQRTCLPDTVESFPPVSADSLASNWRAATSNVPALSWAAKDTGPVGGMVDKVYPAALAAALPRACPLSSPPASPHPKDTKMLAGILWTASSIRERTTTPANARGTLSAEHYEAFWNSPAMTSPEAESYVEGLGAYLYDAFLEDIRVHREEANLIVDDGVREYALQYLDLALSGVTLDSGRRLASDAIYGNLERYWGDTCARPEEDSFSVKRNRWTSRPEPLFIDPYLDAVWSTRAQPYKTTMRLAREFYPEAYEAGLDYYCTY